MRPIWQEVAPADLVTLLNALVGLAAMVVAMDGHFILAAELVLAGILLDGLDGAVARLGLGGSHVGPKLDSLADVVTFAAAPAVVLAAWRPDLVGYAMAGVLAVASLLRLARFEAMRETFPKSYFHGLSSPGAALVVGGLILSPTLAGWAGAVPVAVGAVSLLMLANIRLPKLLGWMGITAVLLIGATLAAHGQSWQPLVVLATLASLAVYVVVGPAYVSRKVDSMESTSPS